MGSCVIDVYMCQGLSQGSVVSIICDKPVEA